MFRYIDWKGKSLIVWRGTQKMATNRFLYLFKSFQNFRSLFVFSSTSRLRYSSEASETQAHEKYASVIQKRDRYERGEKKKKRKNVWGNEGEEMRERKEG